MPRALVDTNPFRYLNGDGIPGDWLEILEILRGNGISNQFFAWTSWGGWASPRQIRQRETDLPITLDDRQLVELTASYEETLAQERAHRASSERTAAELMLQRMREQAVREEAMHGIIQHFTNAHLTPVQQTLSSDYINNVLGGTESQWIQLAPDKRELYLEAMRQFLINHGFDVVTKPKPAERPKHPYGRKF